MPDSRPASKYLVGYRVEQDGITGHWTWHTRIESVDAQGNVTHGPPTLYGIDHEALTSNHGGSHEKFLNSKKEEMLKRHEALTNSHTEAQTLVGKSL